MHVTGVACVLVVFNCDNFGSKRQTSYLGISIFLRFTTSVVVKCGIRMNCRVRRFLFTPFLIGEQLTTLIIFVKPKMMWEGVHWRPPGKLGLKLSVRLLIKPHPRLFEAIITGVVFTIDDNSVVLLELMSQC
eukprot:GFYU01051757.1.p2 GENE.GFYU01051757.1~~GFYU01051757.1.p2  ORF type:complete len:132 (+),score=7.74 GFYU01051757.1:68-463(+)